MKHFRIVLIIGLFVALGAQLPSEEKKAGTPGVTVDNDARTVTIDAKVAPRKLPNLDKIYPLEVIACWPAPKGKKAHETIVIIDARPSDVHKALESLGLKAGKPIMGQGEPKGPAVNVFFLIPDSTGLDRRVTMDKAMVDSRNGKPFPKNIEWRFTGSTMTSPDAAKDEKIYGADYSGTLMAIFPVTSETVLQTELTIKQEGIMKLEVNTKVLPKEGTPVKLVIEVKK
ncbi:MAG: hypothetical protein EXR98_02310 [Gemmataceae bacterium]|nr:hypothetical protein [Gemmataceae bacterium]